jgi:MFS family permease
MLPPRLRWIVFALVFAGIIISYIDRGNLSLAAPLIMRDLHLEPKGMGLLLSVFFWTYAIFQLPAGYLIDRYGIRVVYAVAFTLWSLASASIAISRGPNGIIASRLILGFAESIGPIASLAFIRRYFESKERGLPTALYIGGQTLGPALGTSLGTIVITQYGWRPLFAITGLGALLWVPGWLTLAPKKIPPPDAEQQEKALPALAKITGRGVWALSGAVFFSSYFWWFVMTWMPGYLTLARGFSTAQMGRTFSLPLFGMTVTNLITGWAADRLVARTGKRIEARARIGAIGLIAASALLLLNFVNAPILPVLFLCVCGFGVASANLWTIAQSVVEAPIVGRFIGLLNTLSQVAGAAAPLITGWTLGTHNNFKLAIWLAGLAPLVASACLLAIPASSRR